MIATVVRVRIKDFNDLVVKYGNLMFNVGPTMDVIFEAYSKDLDREQTIINVPGTMREALKRSYTMVNTFNGQSTQISGVRFVVHEIDEGDPHDH